MSSVSASNFLNSIRHLYNLIDCYERSSTAKIDAIELEFNSLKSIYRDLEHSSIFQTIESRVNSARKAEKARKKVLTTSQDQPKPRSVLKTALINDTHQVIIPVQPQLPLCLPARTVESYPAENVPERAPSVIPEGSPLGLLPPTLFLEAPKVDEGMCDPLDESFDHDMEDSAAAEAPVIFTQIKRAEAIDFKTFVSPSTVVTSQPVVLTKLKRAAVIDFETLATPTPVVARQPVMPIPLRKFQVIDMQAMENDTQQLGCGSKLKQRMAAMHTASSKIEVDPEGSEYGAL